MLQMISYPRTWTSTSLHLLPYSLTVMTGLQADFVTFGKNWNRKEQFPSISSLFAILS